MSNFGVYLTSKWDPPFEDWWAIKAIDHDLKQLSEELLSLPTPLPPMLAQLSLIIDKALARRESYWVNWNRRPA
jgi:hypothetical protein